MPAGFSTRHIDPRGPIRSLLLSWLAAVTPEYLLLPPTLRPLAELSGLAQMSLPRLLALAFAGTVILTLCSLFYDTAKAERWSLCAIFAVLAALTLIDSFSWAYLAVCLLILGLLIRYALSGWDWSCEAVPPASSRQSRFLWLTVGLALLFFIFVSVWTVCNVLTYNTATYDFAIFAQMFYHMKETGLAMTTVERNVLISHFDVHASYICYLLLPLYWLFPTPSTLQVAQAAILASAAIPLWLICRRRGWRDCHSFLLCAILLAYPAFAGGAANDFHENCFLTPLLLWLFYGIERKSAPLIWGAALLTLTVKEDAAVYVAVIALWLFVQALLRKGSKRDLLRAALLLAVSVTWFLLITACLALFGDGVMTYRYENLIYDGSGSLLTVIKAIILNPMKAVFECVDAEKLSFIALTVLPLAGLPLLTRRYERYLLLIPYLLFNLLSDYPHQHNIFYQYTFGAIAFLFYLTVLNLSDLTAGWRRLGALVAALAVGASCFGAIILPLAVRYPVDYVRMSSYYRDIRDTLETIPEDASVATTTFYTTALSQREKLYDLGHSSKRDILEAEYIVLNPEAASELKQFTTGGRDNGLENLMRLLTLNGYELFDELPGTLYIYRKTQ